MNEELLYNQLYERTKDFVRSQFIKELMRLEEENQQLKEELQQRNEVIEKARRMLEINIEIMIEQPSKNKLEDKFILDRYNGLLNILNKYNQGDNER